MDFRSAYTASLRVPFDQTIPDPITGEIQVSMTKQSFADESEINNIMAKYEKTGLIEHVKNHGGYSDMPAPLDYQEALQLTIDAQLSFDELPAQVRREFNNNPFDFLAFVENPANVERMAELGLLETVNDAVSPEAHPAPGAAEEPATSAD